MKKQILILAMLLMALVTNAQLDVYTNGNVGIGTTNALQSKFGIGTDGSSGTTCAMKGNGLSILSLENVREPYQYSASYITNLKIESAFSNNNKTIGISSVCNNPSTSGIASSIGVLGLSSCNNSGRSFAVAGLHTGSNNGTGIFGGLGTYPSNTIDGRYAGYFAGDVKVTGALNGVIISSSDSRLKTEVQLLDEKGLLNKLELLSSISFKYDMEKMLPHQTEGDGFEGVANIIELEDGAINEKTNQVYLKTHFGLIAQELQEVFPELVYENDNGYLSVNYIEMIPILMQSIKELNAMVEQQNVVINKLTAAKEDAQQAKSFTDETTSVESVINCLASMEQNVPNPFSEKTDIAIYLPESVKTAVLCIYDLNGSQISKQEVAGRGETTMTIHADEMADGMYIYALIADGKVATTKKMIVSK